MLNLAWPNQTLDFLVVLTKTVTANRVRTTSGQTKSCLTPNLAVILFLYSILQWHETSGLSSLLLCRCGGDVTFVTSKFCSIYWWVLKRPKHVPIYNVVREWVLPTKQTAFLVGLVFIFSWLSHICRVLTASIYQVHVSPLIQVASSPPTFCSCEAT